MENKKYAVVNTLTNICENTIVWDGVAPWQAPSNCYAILIEGLEVGIGYKYEGGVWTDVRFDTTSN